MQTVMHNKWRRPHRKLSGFSANRGTWFCLSSWWWSQKRSSWSLHPTPQSLKWLDETSWPLTFTNFHQLKTLLSNSICKRESESSLKYFTYCTVFENYSKCRIWIFLFWQFPQIFVLLKLTCLVTLFERINFRFSKTRQNGSFLAFLINFCPLKM